jgi:hypothetical protein
VEKNDPFWRIFLSLFILTLLGYASLSFGDASSDSLGFEDAVFPELAFSGRALALGSAYIAKVDDSSAAFYNPAGLGTVRKLKFHLSNIHAEVNMGWVKVATGGKITDALKNLPLIQSLNTFAILVKNNPGTLTNTRYQFVPNITGRFFSIGYLFSRKTRMRLKTSATKIEYADRFDYGPYGSLNLSLFGGIIKVGMTMILLNRHEAQGSKDKDTFSISESDYNIGSGLFSIGGAKLTLPIAWLPTLAVSLHNAFNKNFSSRQGTLAKIKNTIDVGVSLTPKIGGKTRLHMEMNYKDITDQFSLVKPIRKLLIGFEFDFSRSFFLRFGYGDSYGTAGLGFKSKTIDFDLSTYSVNPEPNSNAIRGEEDRRISLSLSSGFGF